MNNSVRVQLTGKEENKADFGATRDRKIPMQKTQSFKGNVWLPFSPFISLIGGFRTNI